MNPPIIMPIPSIMSPIALRLSAPAAVVPMEICDALSGLAAGTRGDAVDTEVITYGATMNSEATMIKVITPSSKTIVYVPV
jgi:spore maturation protein SpmB